MAGTATPIFPQTIKNYVAQIQNSDASNKITIVTGATNGTKIESINVASTDTSARDIALYLTVSAVDYLLTTISIPANSGNTNALPAIDLLASSQFPSLSLDNNTNSYIYIASGAVLKAASTTTLTTAKVIQFVAQGGDY